MRRDVVSMFAPYDFLIKPGYRFGNLDETFQQFPNHMRTHTFFPPRLLFFTEPPSVCFHVLSGVDELSLQFLIVVCGDIQAAEASASADPTQGHALGAQIVLQQPVIATGLLE